MPMLVAAMRGRVYKPGPATIPNFTFYIDPVLGDDTHSGATNLLAWLTPAHSNSQALATGQSIGYKLGGTWFLYRKNGMRMTEWQLPMSVVPTPLDQFIPFFDYYIDPATGDDGNLGTSIEQAWQTPTPSNAITLSAGQTIGYKLSGTWFLYREPGMPMPDWPLPMNLVLTPMDQF